MFYYIGHCSFILVARPTGCGCVCECVRECVCERGCYEVEVCDVPQVRESIAANTKA